MKSKPNVTLSVEDKNAIVEVLKPEVVLEIRYYNIKDRIYDHPDLWIDGDGRQCIRYFLSHKSREVESKKVLENLQYFTVDLKHHAGIEAKLDVSTSPDEFSFLNINNVDYYFQAINGGYDGWGKAMS